jgi:ABC-type Fe3+ transport system permease subunit
VPSTARIGPAAAPDYAPEYPPAYPPAYTRTVIPPAPVSSARSTNRLAILSLVMAFVFAPAGIVLGYMAKRQIRRTGDEGDGLATAGLIAGYAISGVILASCCGLIVFELMDTAGVLGTPRRP